MMYIAALFITVLKCQVVLALDHTTTLFTQLQGVQNGASPAELIACAYRLRKDHLTGFRFAEGTDECEHLNMYQMTSAGLSSGYEYFARETSVEVKATWVYLTHHIISLY